MVSGIHDLKPSYFGGTAMVDISVIIPYHQEREYLFDAIESYEAQEFTGTSELILSHNPLFTLGQNFNAGVAKAKGKYIKVLPDDDLLTPNCLQDLFDAALASDADLIFAQSLNINEGVKSTVTGIEDTNLWTPPDIEFTFENLLERNFIHGGTTLYRTEMFLALRGYDESVWAAEEYEFHLKCLCNGYRVYYTPKVVFHYRMWLGSKSIQDKINGMVKLSHKDKRRDLVDSFRDKYRNLWGELNG